MMPQFFGDVQIWIRRVTANCAGQVPAQMNSSFSPRLYVIRSAYYTETMNPSMSRGNGQSSVPVNPLAVRWVN